MKIDFGLLRNLMQTKKLMRGLVNTSYLVIGHIVATVIGFFGTVYIARVLGPSDYGIYVTVGSFVGLFSLLTFIGINKVVLREGAKDLTQMRENLEKTTGIKNLFTIVAILSCIICSLFMPYPMQVKFYIILFSFSLVYNTFNSFLTTIFQATEKMQYNALLEMLNIVLFTILAVTFLYLGFGVLTLFLISIFSKIFTLIVNYKLTQRFVIFKFWQKIYWDKYILKAALIFSILAFSYFLAGRIDLIMISVLGSSEDVGIYGVSYQITDMAIQVSNFFSIAFFPIFVKTYSKNNVPWKRLMKYSFFLGISILIMAVIVSFYSEQIIVLIFGNKYFFSGTVLSVLVFYVAISFFTMPFSNTLQATHNEIKLLNICWIPAVLNVVLNYLFFNLFGLIGIAYSTIVVSLVGLILYGIITWRTLKLQNKLE